MTIQSRIHHFEKDKKSIKGELHYDFESILRHIPANQTNYATHSFYEYPAKFIPHFPNIFIKHLSEPNETVLDPMCGIGTTLIEACILGRRGLGIDIDPIARLISKVSITPIDEQKLRNLNKQLINDIRNSINDGNLLNIEIPNKEDFPNIDIWFREETIKELLLIKNIISKISEKNKDYKDFATAVLTTIIKSVSNADPRDLMPERDKDMPIRPKQDIVKVFSDALYEKTNKLIDFSKKVNFKKCGEVIGSDARNIQLKDGSVDLVVTSPPYAYAVDYARVTKLSTLLILMSNQKLKEHRKDYIGTDRISLKNEISSFRGFEFAENDVKKIVEKDRRCALVLYNYLKDMYNVTKEIYRVLDRNKNLVYVIGDATIKKTHFATGSVLEKMCKNVGFEIEKILERPYYARRMARKRASHSNVTKNDIFIIAKKVND